MQPACALHARRARCASQPLFDRALSDAVTDALTAAPPSARLQALFDLEATNAELKSDLRDLWIAGAQEIDISASRKAILIKAGAGWCSGCWVVQWLLGGRWVVLSPLLDRVSLRAGWWVLEGHWETQACRLVSACQHTRHAPVAPCRHQCCVPPAG